jgi:hypothetical protein
MVLGLLLIAGCILIPIGQSGYTIGKEIRDEDLAFIELGVTTKSEIVERLGENYIFVEEDKVLYYWWVTQSKYGIVILYPILTGGDLGNLQNYSVYVQFDSDDHVKRIGKLKGKDFKTAQKEWRDSEWRGREGAYEDD